MRYATNIINRVANRESISQFYNSIPGPEGEYFSGRKEESNQDFLGLVKSSDGEYATLEVRNYFKVGDVVQVFGPSMDTIEFKIEEILDEDQNHLEFCNHPKEIVKIKTSYDLEENSMMRTKVFDIFKEI